MKRFWILPSLLLGLVSLVGCDYLADNHNKREERSDPQLDYVATWNRHRVEYSCRDPKDKEHPLHVCDLSVDGSDHYDRPMLGMIPDGYKMTYYTAAREGSPTGWVIKKGRCDDSDANCWNRLPPP